MANHFKPGDLVRLKISNQIMTVVGIIDDRYECVWHDGIKNQKAVFHKDALESIAPYFDSMHFANYE
jgi:uncharacterized protein YodC (DUF2158 family)